MVKPTPPIAPEAPLRSDAAFSAKAQTFLTWLSGGFYSYVGDAVDFVDERADEALAAATTFGFPSIVGRALNFTRVNAAGTALEFLTPAQVRADLEIAAGGGGIAPTVTNLNALSIGGTYYAASGATGAPATGDMVVHHLPADSASRAVQVVFMLTGTNAGAMYTRRETGGVWGAWAFYPVPTATGQSLMTAADAAAARTALGATTTGASVFTAADAAAARAALGAQVAGSYAPLPNTGGGVGTIININAGGVNFALPSGGTWFWSYTGHTGSGNSYIHETGISAGGSVIFPGGGTANIARGWAWRIA
jgi:hypothetical protein